MHTDHIRIYQLISEVLSDPNLSDADLEQIDDVYGRTVRTALNQARSSADKWGRAYQNALHQELTRRRVQFDRIRNSARQ